MFNKSKDYLQNNVSTGKATAAYAASKTTVAHFMSKVYLWMVCGLVLSAATAYYIYSQPTLFKTILTHRGLFFGLIIAQFGAVIVLSWLNQRLNAVMATLIYLLYTVLTGVTLSVVLYAYTQQDITMAFAVTASAFFALSMFGYITKKDLGPLGTFVMMGLFGMIAMMLLSFFIPALRSNTMQMTISAIGVLVFSGLTAYDTQKIKMTYLQLQNNGATTGSEESKFAINGALNLYLDFINLFLSLLRLFGGSRR